MLTAAAALLSVAWLVLKRQAIERITESYDTPPSATLSSPSGEELARAQRRALARAMRAEALIVVALVAEGLWFQWKNWPSPGTSAFELPLAVAAFLLAFPLLVLERRLAEPNGSALPEAGALARVLRVVLIELILATVALLARRAGIEWAYWLMRVAGGFGVAIGVELLLRALVRPFTPVVSVNEARSLIDSAVAGIVLARSGPTRGFSDALRDHFGVDLSRMWAVQFLRSAAAPLLLLLMATTWSLSGTTALAPSERGVYERLGVPVDVVGPGLHLHLPWPFGAMRRVEFDVIHETPVAIEVGVAPEPMVGVEDPPPPGADRLWSQIHPTEGTYLIPGLSSQRSQTGVASFQLVSADVRIDWRIGLTKEAARRAIYHVADGNALVRAIAGRLLVRDFATRPLDKVIGQDRDHLATSMRSDLMTQLDQLGSGLEITAVLIDAIHPPTGVAESYHRVQAAEIAAGTTVSVERTRRARIAAEAQGEATALVRAAEAGGAEQISAAVVARTRFDADRDSASRAGRALALERWLETLARALNRGKLVLIDHRLENEPGPTIDLRPPSNLMKDFEDE